MTRDGGRFLLALVLIAAVFGALFPSLAQTRDARHGWRAAQAAGTPGTPSVILFDRFHVGGLTANQLGRVLDAGRDGDGER